MPLDPAAFDIASPRVRHTNAVLLDALRACAAAHRGRPFPAAAFNAWKHRPCSAGTIIHRFGSWSRALKQIGISGTRSQNHDPEELIENLEAVWRRMGRAPGTHALRANGPISFTAYRKRWGSVREACRRLASYHRGAITRAELLRPAARATPARCRVPLSPGLRWRVLHRDGHRCTSCGRGISRAAGANGRPVILHIDHIVPVSKGGGNDEPNLRTLCSTCNMGRGVGP
jgi:5-methylcytosine-specific restriction endonuclease McrA